MRFPITTVLATLFTGLALVAANPTTTSRTSLNPDPSVLQGHSAVNRRAPAPRPASSLPLTNAKRLQLGLPLKKPVRRSQSGRARIAKRSGTPPVSLVSPHSVRINISNFSRNRTSESIATFWSPTPILVLCSDTYPPRSTILPSTATSSLAKLAHCP